MIKVLKTLRIAIEVNLTSNNVLVLDTFTKEEFRSDDALVRMKGLGVPLVLGTDDDGICPIYECKTHGRHISVAREYCLAIETSQLKTQSEIETLIANGINRAFVRPPSP